MRGGPEGSNRLSVERHGENYRLASGEANNPSIWARTVTTVVLGGGSVLTLQGALHLDALGGLRARAHLISHLLGWSAPWSLGRNLGLEDSKRRNKVNSGEEPDTSAVRQLSSALDGYPELQVHRGVANRARHQMDPPRRENFSSARLAPLVDHHGRIIPSRLP